MNDTEIAKAELGDHSICICKNGVFFTDDGRGISPMMRFIAEGLDMSGSSAADVIVGKAAAMLFVKAGIAEAYGRVMSRAAEEYLTERGIPCSYDTLTDRIINRKGDDICPMEKTVADINDPEEGYRALKARLNEMRRGGTNV